MYQVLEVAIGLVLVFTLVSLAASVLAEWLSGILAMRGKMLWQGIGRMVGKEWEGALCAHPLLQSLSRKTWFDTWFPYLGRSKPSYVPARTFSAALLGALQDAKVVSPGDDLATVVGKLPAGHLKQALQPLVDQAHRDVAQAEANIEHWFDTSMDRVTGWYKRWSQLVLFLLGLGTALWFGIDSIALGGALWTDDQLRADMVQVAEGMLEDECRELFAGEDAADGGDASGSETEEAEETEAAEGTQETEETEPLTAQECLEDYRDRLAGFNLPLVPFVPRAGDGDSGLGRRATSWPPWLLGFAFAAGLFWLDGKHRETPPEAQGGAVRALTFAGRSLLVLLVGVVAAFLVTGVIGRYASPELLGWLGGHLPGFLLTAVAVSFGAPFWFDLLGRLVKLRTSGSRPQPPAPGASTAASPRAPAPP